MSANRQRSYIFIGLVAFGLGCLCQFFFSDWSRPTEAPSKTAADKEQNQKRRAQLQLTTIRQLKAEVKELRQSLEETKKLNQGLYSGRYEAKIQELVQSHKQQIETIKQKQKALQRELAKEKTQKSTLIMRLKELVRKKPRDSGTLDKIDGEVTRVHHEGKRVTVDLGRSEWLRPGAYFQVFEKTAKGIKIKGLIQLIKVSETNSEALVIRRKLYDPVKKVQVLLPSVESPIQAGDFIRNPMFEKGEKPTFIILGKDLESKHISLPDLINKLEDQGAIVRRELTAKGDYVVFLDEKDEEFKSQLEMVATLGTVVLRERELLDIAGIKP